MSHDSDARAVYQIVCTFLKLGEFVCPSHAERSVNTRQPGGILWRILDIKSKRFFSLFSDKFLLFSIYSMIFSISKETR